MKQYNYSESGCRNCGTLRYEERSAGYCKRCAYKAAKLRRLRAGTWKKRGRYPRLDEDAEFGPSGALKRNWRRSATWKSHYAKRP